MIVIQLISVFQCCCIFRYGVWDLNLIYQKKEQLWSHVSTTGRHVEGTWTLTTLSLSSCKKNVLTSSLTWSPFKMDLQKGKENENYVSASFFGKMTISLLSVRENFCILWNQMDERWKKISSKITFVILILF